MHPGRNFHSLSCVESSPMSVLKSGPYFQISRKEMVYGISWTQSGRIGF